MQVADCIKLSLVDVGQSQLIKVDEKRLRLEDFTDHTDLRQPSLWYRIREG
jgi:hypothetical protein